MTASRSSYPPVSGAHPVAPPSLASIALALSSCQHPDLARVSAKVTTQSGPARITWCAHCGAMSSDEVPDTQWQRPALAMLLAAKSHLSELSQALHVLRSCHAVLARDEGAATARPAVSDPELRAALVAIAQTALYRDLERLDRGLGVPGLTDPPLL